MNRRGDCFYKRYCKRCDRTFIKVVHAYQHNHETGHGVPNTKFRLGERRRWKYGENHYRAKLTWAQVGRIRWLLDNSDLTQTQLGERYKVDASTIGSIKLRETWIKRYGKKRSTRK